MKYTGERFIPNCDGPEIEAEHVHRYRVISRCVKKMKVLDAGCGTGYGSFILAQYADSVTGIDISNESIEWCKEHYGIQDNMAFIQASLEELPFKDGEFDCIVNLEVIEHVDKNVQEAFLKEAKRVLKPTGVLMMSTPNKMVYTDKSGYHNPYHVREFYEDEFIHFLAEEFDTIKLYNQSLYTVSTILNEKEIDSNAQIIKNNDIDSTEKYMIALCGNNKEAISLFDLNSVYKFDNPMGVSIASLYAAAEGNAYSLQLKQSIALNVQADNLFSITFDISHYSGISQFRFDPIEDHFCVCNIQETLTDGKIDSVLPLNALEYHKTGFVFMNIDPQFEIKGDFSNATYLTLKGYFKTMSQIQISEFVDAFYNKMMNESKNANSYEQFSQSFSETKALISEQRIALQNIQTKLLEHQNDIFKNSQLLNNLNESLISTHRMISEEKSNIVDMIAKQEELLQQILKRGNLGMLFSKLCFWNKKRS